MAIKDYSEDLPSNFNTWVEFWDEVVKMQLHKGYETVQITGGVGEVPRDKTYSVQFIKDAAFEELLSDRMERQEVKNWINGVERGLYDLGYRHASSYVEKLPQVKRILLTQSYRK